MATINGTAGNDTLTGTTGADSISGKAGNDIIRGNGGTDNLYGDAGDDIIYTGNDFPSGTNLYASTARGGDGNDHFYSGGGISQLVGEAGNDTFHADQGLWTGSEYYSGGDGYDRIVADSANQNIGIDRIYQVEEITGQGFSNVTIQTATRSSNFLDLSGVKLTGIALVKGQGGNDVIIMHGGSGTGDIALSRNDIVNGGAGNDKIYSGFGNDIVRGEAGNDELTGGTGVDTLTGGAGSDVFRYAFMYESSFGNADTITDFRQTDGDKIDLTYIDANPILDNNQAFIFIGTNEFSGSNGQLRYEFESDGNTHVYGYIDTDTTVDVEIIITGNVALVESDFIL